MNDKVRRIKDTMGIVTNKIEKELDMRPFSDPDSVDKALSDARLRGFNAEFALLERKLEEVKDE